MTHNQMQFAAWMLKDGRKILIAAEEVEVVKKFFDTREQVEDVRLDLDEFDTKNHMVVYGSYLPSWDRSLNTNKEAALQNLKEGINKRLGFYKDYKCYPLHLIDIETYEYNRYKHVPFAAFIAVEDIEIPNDMKEHALVSFIRYFNMTPLDNIFNREGIFAFKMVEESGDHISMDNWKDFIKKERIAKIAETIY